MPFEHSHSDEPSSDLTQAISPVPQFHWFLFFATFLRCSSSLSNVGHCSNTYYLVSDWYSLKINSYRQDIRNDRDLIFSILLSTSYLTTLIVNLPVSLILIIFVSHCLCFLLIWLVHSLYTLYFLIPALCFLCQMVRQRKLLFGWNFNFLL